MNLKQLSDNELMELFYGDEYDEMNHSEQYDIKTEVQSRIRIWGSDREPRNGYMGPD